MQIVEISKKICMLGSFGVGKTSLVRQFVFREFQENYFSTIGVQMTQKILPPFENTFGKRTEQLKLILWDLAHVEKFDSVVKNYFRGAHGAIVVFDLTRPQSFKNTNIFLKPFIETNPDSKIIIVGNKIDLTKKENIDTAHFEKFTEKYKTDYLFTSARTGENVEELFLKLGKLILGDS